MYSGISYAAKLSLLVLYIYVLLYLQWNLVCSRTWLVSTISAVFMAGNASGSIIFGYFADRLVIRALSQKHIFFKRIYEVIILFVFTYLKNLVEFKQIAGI